MRILVTGASGFIGSAIARRLRELPDVELRTTRHTRQLPGAVALDLRDLSGVARAVADTDVVIHAAHAIGGAAADLERVNVAGTAGLLDACAPRTRVIAVSTASVYGPGPWRGLPPEQMPDRPSSPTSLTRAAGDRLVLARGDLVVRPHLVYGPGDRWFLPRAARITQLLGGYVAPWTRHNAIHVDTLGAAIAELALAPHRTGVVVPCTPAGSLRPIIEAALATPVGGEISHHDALVHPVGREDPLWVHDIGLLGLDHHIASG